MFRQTTFRNCSSRFAYSDIEPTHSFCQFHNKLLLESLSRFDQCIRYLDFETGRNHIGISAKDVFANQLYRIVSALWQHCPGLMHHVFMVEDQVRDLYRFTGIIHDRILNGTAWSVGEPDREPCKCGHDCQHQQQAAAAAASSLARLGVVSLVADHRRARLCWVQNPT